MFENKSPGAAQATYTQHIFENESPGAAQAHGTHAGYRVMYCQGAAQTTYTRNSFGKGD